ncbi:MAG: 1-deoxy-D-xylulose-5-phosphate reductoisomerase, partial [Tepidiformaceae bacterium]
MTTAPVRVAVLGSTGSVGRQSLDVIRQLPGRFKVAALAAGRNSDELARQVAEFRPTYVSCEVESPALRDAASAAGTRFASMDDVATAEDVDILLVGTAGAAGLTPTLKARRLGRPGAIA